VNWRAYYLLHTTDSTRAITKRERRTSPGLSARTSEILISRLEIGVSFLYGGSLFDVYFFFSFFSSSFSFSYYFLLFSYAAFFSITELRSGSEVRC
jgi:hypothetical protein